MPAPEKSMLWTLFEGFQYIILHNWQTWKKLQAALADLLLEIPLFCVKYPVFLN